MPQSTDFRRQCLGGLAVLIACILAVSGLLLQRAPEPVPPQVATSGQPVPAPVTVAVPPAVDEAPLAGAEDIVADAAPAGIDEETADGRILQGELAAGDTLDGALRRLGLEDGVRQAIVTHLADCLDFRRLRPSDRFTIALDANGRLRSCLYEAGPLEIYQVTATGGGYQAQRLPVEVEERLEVVQGTITSSLFEAFQASGEGPTLIYAFADIFAARIDFNTETRSGDRFTVLVPKYYRDGAFLGYGTIRYGRYQGRIADLEAFYYRPDGDPAGGYYDADGRDLGSAFIRSPVPVGRVSSRFTLRRKHPILGRTIPHLGVDLAAPTGTPVMVTADGVVQFAGRRGGFGKQVIVQHAGGFKTYYGHLSRFAKGIRPGKRVRQKEIIGYVGATGLATGPHLDYRLAENGVFKNPFALRFRPKKQLTGAAVAAFTKVREEVTATLAALDGKDETVAAARTIAVATGNELNLL